MCVVLYLAEDLARFSPVADDGSFRFDAAASGTYAIGFLGCGEEGEGDDSSPEPVIVDPSTGVGYALRGGAVHCWIWISNGLHRTRSRRMQRRST